MLRAVDLRCDGRRDPLAVAAAAPRLSFRVEPATGAVGPASRVTAWEVRAASSPALLARGRCDLWESGRRSGSAVHDVRYGGAPPERGGAAHWCARVWDGEGRPGPWSAPSSWEPAPSGEELARAARWIGGGAEVERADEERYGDDPAPLLRAELDLPSEPARARLHVAGLGWYEARVNGARVGDAVLDAAWTPYRRRVLYATHDVTALLARGRNAIGVVLGKGWYDPLPMRLWGYLNLREHLECGRPSLLALLECLLEDGSRVSLATGPGWRAGAGGLLFDNVYLGERFDARREPEGWTLPGFDDRDWLPAAPLPAPPGRLEPEEQPPVRVLRDVAPRSVAKVAKTANGRPADDAHVVDFGENFTGWVRLSVRGPRGARVRLRFGELLHEDGTLNVATSVCGKLRPGGDAGGPGAPELACQEDVYVLRGGGEETYEPRFTFHAFRYVEVTGWPGGAPPAGSLVGRRVSADLEEAGTFECSSPRLEEIHAISRRTFRNNLLGVQSDCPHRERFGYGGDLVACSEAIAFCYDVSRFYAKVARDYADEARSSGGLPEIAPDVGIDNGGIEPGVGPVEWGTALPHLLDLLARFYGERDELERGMDAVLGWVRFLDERAPDGLLESELSDWEALEEKPKRVTGTAFLHESARLGAELARRLGVEEDAARCDALARRVREAFRRAFVDERTGVVAPGGQIAQAHAAGLRLTEGEVAERVFAALLAAIAHRDGRLATGFFGTRLAFDALVERGRSDVALAAVDRAGFPGWGHMLERGATTLWEQWPWDDVEPSHDHPAFGSVVAWLYRGLAGIHPEGAAGPEARVLLRPQVDCGLDAVRARHRTVRGWVGVAWRRAGDEVEVDVSLPPNLAAELRLDAAREGTFDLPPGEHRVRARLVARRAGA